MRKRLVLKHLPQSRIVVGQIERQGRDRCDSAPASPTPAARLLCRAPSGRTRSPCQRSAARPTRRRWHADSWSVCRSPTRSPPDRYREAGCEPDRRHRSTGCARTRAAPWREPTPAPRRAGWVSPGRDSLPRLIGVVCEQFEPGLEAGLLDLAGELFLVGVVLVELAQVVFRIPGHHLAAYRHDPVEQRERTVKLEPHRVVVDLDTRAASPPTIQ